MTFPTLLSFILGATVDVTLLAYGARRLLAERRSRAARSRRYWQIVRIFTRCGVRPLGRAPQGSGRSRWPGR